MSSNSANVEDLEIHAKVYAAVEAQDPQAGVKAPANVEQLYRAIRAGDVKQTEKLLTRYKTLINVEYQHATPLRIAATMKHFSIIRLLLDRGADVNKTYLRISDPQILRTAEENGSLCTLQHLSNSTVLHGAAENDYVHIVELFLLYGANVDAKNGNDATPLHLASRNGHSNVVKLLLKNGADVGAKDCNGLTPLYIAVAQGNLEISEILLKHHAAVHEKYPNDKTVLHLAAQNRHPLVVELLLKYKANINAVDIDHITPLYIAAMIGHVDIIEILLENNASMNIAYSHSQTPLQIAQKKGHGEVVAMLQSHQQLREALRKEKPDVPKIKELLDRGAILANQDKKWLLKPELSSILLDREKNHIRRIFSSANIFFPPLKMYFENEFLVIDFRNSEDTNFFLKTIAIISESIECTKTKSNMSVRLKWPFAVDEASLETEFYRQRKTQLEKRLNSLSKQLSATGWAITAITLNPNETSKSLWIFFPGIAVDSFELKNEQISITSDQKGTTIGLPVEFLLEPEKKETLDAYICKIIHKRAEKEAKEAPLQEMKRAEKEEAVLERLRISTQLKEEMEKEEKRKRRNPKKKNKKKEIAFNQPGKENPLLAEIKTLTPEKPSVPQKVLRKREPNFFGSPVTHESPKQNEDRNSEVKPRETTKLDTWRSNPQSSLSAINEHNSYEPPSSPSPK